VADTDSASALFWLERIAHFISNRPTCASAASTCNSCNCCVSMLYFCTSKPRQTEYLQLLQLPALLPFPCQQHARSRRSRAAPPRERIRHMPCSPRHGNCSSPCNSRCHRRLVNTCRRTATRLCCPSTSLRASAASTCNCCVSISTFVPVNLVNGVPATAAPPPASATHMLFALAFWCSKPSTPDLRQYLYFCTTSVCLLPKPLHVC